MNKKNLIMWLIAFIISVSLLIFISNKIFYVANGVNEGQFRVIDAILTSNVNVEDVNEDKTKWEINVSQNNNLSILIKGMDNAKMTKVEVDKIKIKKTPKIGTIYLSSPRTKEMKNVINNKNESVAIYIEEKESNTYFIEIDIINKDIIKNFVLPDTTKEIRHDGTVIAMANKKISDVYFELSFDLNVTSETGIKTKTKINLELPEKSLIENGQVVTRLSLNDFCFKK